MFHAVEYFLNKLHLKMLFEVIIYTLEIQIIAIKKKKKKEQKDKR